MAASQVAASSDPQDHAPPLQHVPAWQQAYAQGAEPSILLRTLRTRITARGASNVWLHVVDAAALTTRIAKIEARAATFPDRAAALAAMPLWGVPFAVKDNIAVAGMPTSAACPAFVHVASDDAHAVGRLLEAGAVCIGKTNLDQFATGLVGTRSPYGRPSSVYDENRISGGSSSGSAVAVACGHVPFALGTDTAGSGRVPAGFNRLVGWKPTPGRIGAGGVVPACRSLDCVSVFAHTVADAALVGALMEGPDAADAYSAYAPGPAAWRPKLRIGVPQPVAPLDDAIGYPAAWARAQQWAAAAGHALVGVDFAPLHAVAGLLYSGPWVAERHAAVQALLDRDPGAFDPAVRQVIASATAYSATDAFRGHYALRAAQAQLSALWTQVDVLMVPTAPMHPTFAHVDADPIGVNTRLGTYTNFVNLLGWCALALPAGDASPGLPFGVTFIAPGGHDAALARFGLAWEAAVRIAATQATGNGSAAIELAPSPPPTRWLASEPTLTIAVVGAHLSGLPLNGQLTERGATLLEATTTAPCYRLYALPGTVPPKPGLQRAAAGEPGGAIAVELWELPLREVGSFLALIPPPLGLGSIELQDGRQVHGFLCEAHALAQAEDITALGGWRAFLNRR